MKMKMKVAASSIFAVVKETQDHDEMKITASSIFPSWNKETTTTKQKKDQKKDDDGDEERKRAIKEIDLANCSNTNLRFRMMRLNLAKNFFIIFIFIVRMYTLH